MALLILINIATAILCVGAGLFYINQAVDNAYLRGYLDGRGDKVDKK